MRRREEREEKQKHRGKIVYINTLIASTTHPPNFIMTFAQLIFPTFPQARSSIDYHLTRNRRLYSSSSSSSSSSISNSSGRGASSPSSSSSSSTAFKTPAAAAAPPAPAPAPKAEESCIMVSAPEAAPPPSGWPGAGAEGVVFFLALSSRSSLGWSGAVSWRRTAPPVG